MKISNNRFLLGVGLFNAAYWVVGAFAPKFLFTQTINLSLVVAAGLTFLRFAPDALAILFKGLRNDKDQDGSHFVAFGVAGLAWGSIYGALFSLLLYLTGVPLLDWLNTPTSHYGRAVVAACFMLIFIAPSVTATGIRISRGAWFYSVAALIIVAVYLIGFQNGAKSDEAHILGPETKPLCPISMPILGNVTSRGFHVYHTLDSPYRAQVKPERCFKSEDEALTAGFRKAG